MSYKVTRINEVELGDLDVEESPIISQERDRASTFSPYSPDDAPTILTFDKIKVTSKKTSSS